MPKGRKHLTREDDTWLATCFAKATASPLEIDRAECDWDRLCTSESLAREVAVLHVLVKHPQQYKEITGKDPEKAAFDYREQIEALRRHL